MDLENREPVLETHRVPRHSTGIYNQQSGCVKKSANPQTEQTEHDWVNSRLSTGVGNFIRQSEWSRDSWLLDLKTVAADKNVHVCTRFSCLSLGSD